MSAEGAISFFIAILVFSITPGPGVFAIIARALVNGARACTMLALGMAISDIIYLIAASYGLAALATHWSEGFLVVRVLGAIYLVYLGWKMWNAPLELETAESTARKTDASLSFLQGFLISASNPKVILFYIAFLPTFMDLSVLSNADIALASILTVLGLMIGLMAIAYFAAQARRWFQSKGAVKNLNRSAGSVMVAAGAYLISRS
jgi:threonine/homoserine/homoserine lactone efflux protein